MNKRQKKKAHEWWSTLELWEKREYFEVVFPGKNNYIIPEDYQIERIYEWAN